MASHMASGVSRDTMRWMRQYSSPFTFRRSPSLNRRTNPSSVGGSVFANASSSDTAANECRLAIRQPSRSPKATRSS